MAIIAPSVLSADFGNLQRDIEFINGSAADWFHVDIMDGVFVPNISFGFPVLKALQKHATKPLDVHLMIKDADPYISTFKEYGAEVLTVHYEACTHLHRTLQNIRSQGMKAGVAINPHTSITLLENIVHEADLFLVMSVNPGFGGQQFIPNTYLKVRQLKRLLEETGSKALIEVDGGVGLNNYRQLLEAGADALVAGNAVFGAADPAAVITEMKS
jgi:ribulose-phosphate 3-epimerase